MITQDVLTAAVIEGLFETCEAWERALVVDDVDAAAELEVVAKIYKTTLEEALALDEKLATKFGPELVEIIARFPFLED